MKNQCCLAFIALLGVTACGEGLVDDRYLGEPLLSLHGTLFDQTICVPVADDGIPACSSVYGNGEALVSVLWADRALTGDTSSTATVVETATTRASLPARFTLEMHTPPDPSVMLSDGQGGRYAWGLVAVFTDRDGDGRFTAGTDWLLGGGQNAAVVYTESGALIPGTEDDHPWPAGYSIGSVDADDSGCAGGFLGLEPPEAEHGVPTVSITINGVSPELALPDTDCDNTLSEWWTLCPAIPDTNGRDKFCSPDFRVCVVECAVDADCNAGAPCFEPFCVAGTCAATKPVP
jgi:hypothetical protein